MDKDKKSDREVRRLRQAQSKYTVQLVQVIEEDDKVYMVMELLPGGNLLSRVIQKKSLSEAAVKRIAFQLIQAALHLHQDMFICHNNIEPANILFVDDKDKHPNRVKLADFGAATTCTSAAFTKSGCPPPYRAPEHQATAAADMWSIGVVLYFCLLGEAEKDQDTLLNRLHKADPKCSETRKLSRFAKQFLCSLIHIDPDVRMTAQEALSHPWLRNVTQKPVKKKSRGHVRRDSRASGSSSDSRLRKNRPGKRIVRSISRFVTYLKRPDDMSSTGASCSFNSQDATEVTAEITESISMPGLSRKDSYL